MTQSNDLSPPPPAAPALPKSLVLNYLTTAGTPTRVRKIAAICTLAFAFSYLSIGVVTGMVLAKGICDSIASGMVMFAPGWLGPAPVHPLTLSSFLAEAQAECEFNPAPFVCVGVCLLCGLVDVIFIASVKRGRRFASNAVFLTVLPAMAGIALAAATFTAAAVVDGLGLVPPRDVAAACEHALALPVGMLLILLMKDFCAFLRWIARNPVAEKPPVPFLPQKQPS